MANLKNFINNLVDTLTKIDLMTEQQRFAEVIDLLLRCKVEGLTSLEETETRLYAFKIIGAVIDKPYYQALSTYLKIEIQCLFNDSFDKLDFSHEQLDFSIIETFLRKVNACLTSPRLVLIPSDIAVECMPANHAVFDRLEEEKEEDVHEVEMDEFKVIRLTANNVLVTEELISCTAIAVFGYTATGCYPCLGHFSNDLAPENFEDIDKQVDALVEKIARTAAPAPIGAIKVAFLASNYASLPWLFLGIKKVAHKYEVIQVAVGLSSWRDNEQGQVALRQKAPKQPIIYYAIDTPTVSYLARFINKFREVLTLIDFLREEKPHFAAVIAQLNKMRLAKQSLQQNTTTILQVFQLVGSVINKDFYHSLPSEARFLLNMLFDDQSFDPHRPTGFKPIASYLKEVSVCLALPITLHPPLYSVPRCVDLNNTETKVFDKLNPYNVDKNVRFAYAGEFTQTILREDIIIGTAGLSSCVAVILRATTKSNQRAVSVSHLVELDIDYCYDATKRQIRHFEKYVSRKQTQIIPNSLEIVIFGTDLNNLARRYKLAHKLAQKYPESLVVLGVADGHFFGVGQVAVRLTSAGTDEVLFNTYTSSDAYRDCVSDEQLPRVHTLGHLIKLRSIERLLEDCSISHADADDFSGQESKLPSQAHIARKLGAFSSIMSMAGAHPMDTTTEAASTYLATPFGLPEGEVCTTTFNLPAGR